MIRNPLLYLSNKKEPLTVFSGPFRGAKLFLNPRHGKRQLFGIYEQVLNPWLERVLPDVEVVYDVGANDGYFTYGCAKAIKEHKNIATILAFEPGLLHEIPELTQPAEWPEYQGITFEFIARFVGSHVDERTITLDRVFSEKSSLSKKKALVKVDVEGAEINVLEGARSLLDAPNQWVVEVHGDHLLEPVLSFFRKANREVEVLQLHPHWLFGPEKREIKTSWVVTMAS